MEESSELRMIVEESLSSSTIKVVVGCSGGGKVEEGLDVVETWPM